MAAGLAPPQRGPQAPPAGGRAGGLPSSGAGPAINSQELASNYEALFAAYSQLEMNQKAKTETEAKFNTMIDRLRAG